jgi:anti-sigma B factor antagonist
VSGVSATGGDSPPDGTLFRADLELRETRGAEPGRAAVVSVTGDVDMHSQARLRDVLTEAVTAPVQRVVLDLSGVEFMASAGVHVLLDVAGQLETAGGTLVVAGACSMVARVLSLTRADELVPVAATVDDALAG